MRSMHRFLIFLIAIILSLFIIFYVVSKKQELHNVVYQTAPGASRGKGFRAMLTSVDFEVFGQVQGVFFRKYTKEKAKELGVKGWVMNNYHGTVVGIIQGQGEKVEEMKHWLQHVGSPHSVIAKCEFKNQRAVVTAEYKDFSVKN